MEVTPRLHSQFVLAVFTGMVAVFQSERRPFTDRNSGRFRPEYALARFMPELERYFHYRNIDVSTLKELAFRWQPQLERFEKGKKHLALEDIKESIAELRYYKQYFFLAC